MTIKSDKWIRRMAEQHGLIEPFEPGQVREVDGRRVEVSLPGDLAFGGSHNGGTVRRKAKARTRGGAAGAAASGDAV